MPDAPKAIAPLINWLGEPAPQGFGPPRYKSVTATAWFDVARDVTPEQKDLLLPGDGGTWAGVLYFGQDGPLADATGPFPWVFNGILPPTAHLLGRNPATEALEIGLGVYESGQDPVFVGYARAPQLPPQFARLLINGTDSAYCVRGAFETPDREATRPDALLWFTLGPIYEFSTGRLSIGRRDGITTPRPWER
jgi:hypothetical protein